MCGLDIDITSFMHLLKTVYFDSIVDHLALVYIVKSKAEPATTRIKRLLEVLISFSFNLYYIKGKGMILSDFLSRQKNNDSNLHEAIPFSFNMQSILYDRYYNIGEREEEEKYLIQTRSQYKSSGITLPAVHGIDKGINPSLKPEKQVIKPMKMASEVKTPTQIKLRTGQDRAGLKRKMKISNPLQPDMPAQMVNKPILQKPESTTQPQTSLELGPQTRYILVPQTRSGRQSKPRLISKELLPYFNPVHCPLPDHQTLYMRIGGLHWT